MQDRLIEWRRGPSRTGWLLIAALIGTGGCASDQGGVASDGGDGRAAEDTALVEASLDTPASSDVRIVDGPAIDRAEVDLGRDGAPASDQAAADLGQDCAQLQAQYAGMLEQVRVCNPFTALQQCETKIPDALDCPCDTYVNTGAITELKQMLALKDQWTALGCQPAGCPPVACPTVVGGQCEEVGSGPATTGRCTDVTAN